METEQENTPPLTNKIQLSIEKQIRPPLLLGQLVSTELLPTEEDLLLKLASKDAVIRYEDLSGAKPSKGMRERYVKDVLAINQQLGAGWHIYSVRGIGFYLLQNAKDIEGIRQFPIYSDRPATPAGNDKYTAILPYLNSVQPTSENCFDPILSSFERELLLNLCKERFIPDYIDYQGVPRNISVDIFRIRAKLASMNANMLVYNVKGYGYILEKAGLTGKSNPNLFLEPMNAQEQSWLDLYSEPVLKQRIKAMTELAKVSQDMITPLLSPLERKLLIFLGTKKELFRAKVGEMIFSKLSGEEVDNNLRVLIFKLRQKITGSGINIKMLRDNHKLALVLNE